MDTLTEDLFVVEILSRLPIKTLYSVRCVCNQWRSLYKFNISDPKFVKLHKLRNPDNNHDSFIAHRFRSQCHKLSVINTNFCNRDPVNLTLPFPTSTKSNGFDVVGSCNGVLCLSYVRKKKPRNRLFLWNPATGQLKDIPNYKIGIKLDNCDVSVGFGFDHASSDYKVVRIVRYQSKGFPSDVTRVEVYSLKKNAWKEIDVDLKFTVVAESFCECVKGVFYWLTYDDYVPGLVSFNVQSEKFSPVSLPNDIGWLRKIFNLEESLAIVKFHSPKTSILTLDDDKGTWKEMRTLKGDEEIEDIIGGLNTGKFVGKTVCGEVFLCDPLKNSVKTIQQLSNYKIRIHNYSPSLAIM
ncbi:hypothetical protein POM88_032207 [Heracleum sosnowskyi]|uniref:F-box domain-containing protein n=1 Tax=Heracleum sosnowskyi TaxID=360622 RepID=A0AAD8HYU3_9APIA|nr:hypothetical protein POM88_032207 [Heracleum sosnowskyi]